MSFLSGRRRTDVVNYCFGFVEVITCRSNQSMEYNTEKNTEKLIMD
jgi:hypothetical protein